jgi:hypothetical protein
MTIEQFEIGIKQGVKILAKWANREGSNCMVEAIELYAIGYGRGIIDAAFSIAENSEGDENLIEDGLRKLLAEWNPA